MNNEKALMLTTKECLIAFFNKLYGNNTPGALRDCIELSRRLPCSNCLPRFIGPLYFPVSSTQTHLLPFPAAPSPSEAAPKPPVKTQKLTKKMRATTELELCLFRDHVYELERNNDSHGFTPLAVYFNDPTITSILNHFIQITSLEILSDTIPWWKYHSQHGLSLLALISGLQRDFAAQFEAVRLDRNKKSRLHAKSKCTAALDQAEDDDIKSKGDISEVEDDVVEPPPIPPTLLRIRNGHGGKQWKGLKI
ncbi:hypothetical protein DFH07DRAFT_952212 [Mycena maculata]|uniref:Uncharacterized protein n=1 Tax=Mycena maculata TaxID=230809 RepID=A0AAD7JYJ9_9AGAR|nr:hypothetical protein DFH07DRAFT_952212 [Mycena maculata]